MVSKQDNSDIRMDERDTMVVVTNNPHNPEIPFLPQAEEIGSRSYVANLKRKLVILFLACFSVMVFIDVLALSAKELINFSNETLSITGNNL